MTLSPFERLAAIAFAATAIAAVAPQAAQAQAWPTKPVTLVVPFSAGGPTDVVARLLGATMTRTLGQSVLIENKTGAGGTIAAAYTARAQPDGYTFLIHHNGMATAPTLYGPAVRPDAVGFSEYRIEPGRVRITFRGGPGAPVQISAPAPAGQAAPASNAKQGG